MCIVFPPPLAMLNVQKLCPSVSQNLCASFLPSLLQIQKIQKCRECNPLLYRQSPLLNTRRVPCYRSKKSYWSIKKRSTVVQSSTRWQNRPHWSELKPVHFSYSKYPITFKTPSKTNRFKNSHSQITNYFNLAQTLVKCLPNVQMINSFFSLSAQKSRC